MRARIRFEHAFALVTFTITVAVSLGVNGCAHPPPPRPLTPAQAEREVETIERIREEVLGRTNQARLAGTRTVEIQWDYEDDPATGFVVMRGERVTECWERVELPSWARAFPVRFEDAPAGFYRVGADWVTNLHTLTP